MLLRPAHEPAIRLPERHCDVPVLHALAGVAQLRADVCDELVLAGAAAHEVGPVVELEPKLREVPFRIVGDAEVDEREPLGLACFPTPGHASHHVSYLDRDGTLYAGDAAGVRIQPGRKVLPPTPPPEFDLDAWQSTLEEIERRGPERLALIHFGVADDPQRHLAELRLELYDWAEFVLGGAGEDEFVAYVRTELRDAGERLDDWNGAMPFWQSYRGLARWAEKHTVT